MSFLTIVCSLPDLHREGYISDFSVREISGYHQVGAPQGAFFVRLKKRSAYPGTFCRQIDSETIVLGYGAQSPNADDEFLHITVKRNGSIYIARDIYATLPLFYGLAGQTFAISNTYTDICQLLPHLTESAVGTVETLAVTPSHFIFPWEEIHVLGERHQLQFTAAPPNVTVIPPASRTWLTSPEAPQTDPRDFWKVFSAQLDAFTERCLSGQHIAFEVSGGLDSAALPLYLAQKHGQLSTPAVSLSFPGKFGVSQYEKTNVVSHIAGLTMQRIELETVRNKALLGAVIDDPAAGDFYCPREAYLAGYSAMAENLKQQGVEVIIRGTGGDDCFENVLDPAQVCMYGTAEKQRRSKALAPYFTAKFTQEYMAAVQETAPYPMPLLPVSYQRGQLAHESIYIDHDIWPVTPFADAELYTFCQGLPAHFRSNKNILRLFFEAASIRK
jgi:asparagine synthetase B (glutamine-hydrolysing)